MSKTKRLAVFAVLAALIGVFPAIPIVFMLPVLVACLAFGPREGWFSTLAFGAISLAYSFLGGSFVALMFVQNLWIPIVARLAVPPAVLGLYALLKPLSKNKEGALSKKGEFARLSVSTAAGSLANTLSVTLCVLIAVYAGAAGQAEAFLLYLPTVAIMGAAELVFSAAAAPFVVLAVRKIPWVAYEPLFKRVIKESPAVPDGNNQGQ